MAGIREAMKRVMDGKNLGHVVALGELNEVANCTCDGDSACSSCRKTKYAIIRLEDGGLITQYDYGADIHIAKDIQIRDYVMLMIIDNWNAEWQRMDLSREVPNKN